MNSQVIIIGAGLSGLRAASVLSDHGIACQVLEARDRIGGRILSKEVEGKPEFGRYDLGPTWFWPRYEPKMTALAEDLKLDTFAQADHGRIVMERSLHEPLQYYELSEGAMDTSLRIAGGVHTLIASIKNTLPEGIVRLNSRVTAITQKDDKTVNIEVNGGKERITAKAVIFALPPRLIARHIAFEPGLPQELRNQLMNKPTWMAAQAKAVVIYDRPFWREQGLSGFASSWVGPLQEIHDASPVPGHGTGGALFGFFGINANKRLELGEERLKELIREQLVRLFGPQAKDNVAILYKDWSTDPDTAVLEDADPISDYPDYGPPDGDVHSWDKTIYFAGTETSRVQGGHLEGALQSADRAAMKVIEQLK
ncbi:flavin monoamine oxidase family protein [Paenibacillus glycanilyticus]|uniref:Amine oxidase domain-containing protein n=1 Tax=Paenibacillus glycanilyticus TaxID=126569 RepID=A0ABQ6G8F5_9BACL|nr:FAD-dependent oxidoreductase [Paenibacillus glycanilyticus]GLX66897.1 hypothetical protein MU1_12410 [Paenibacillus glycanilyticus]